MKSIIFWDMTPRSPPSFTCMLPGFCWNYIFDPEDGGDVPLKCRLKLDGLHGVIFQKMILFIREINCYDLLIILTLSTLDVACHCLCPTSLSNTARTHRANFWMLNGKLVANQNFSVTTGYLATIFSTPDYEHNTHKTYRTLRVWFI
jgi:hypothetical protein